MPSELKQLDSSKMYTLNEAASLLPSARRKGQSLTAATLRTWIVKGKLKAKSWGNSYLISGAELNRLMGFTEETDHAS
jgi:hypothetical protein